MNVQARRHRVLHQRHSARRLREDGGREPGRRADGRAGRVPVEGQVAAVPGPDHGTGDEPRARRRRDGARALPGRRSFRPLPNSPPVDRHRRAGLRRARPRASSPAIASSACNGRRSRELGPVLDGDRHAGRTARSRSAVERDGRGSTRCSHAQRPSTSSRSATSASARRSARRSPRSTPASRAEAGLKEATLILAADGEWYVNHEQLHRDHQGAATGKPLELEVERDGEHTADITVTPRKIGTAR